MAAVKATNWGRMLEIRRKTLGKTKDETAQAAGMVAKSYTRKVRTGGFTDQELDRLAAFLRLNILMIPLEADVTKIT